MDGADRSSMVVCVTGAGGFIGSSLVKELLQRGYTVRGTARNPEDPKNAHLHSLDGARERLSLHRADVLDYKSLCAAFSLCHSVFHVACPISDNDPELMAIAVEGTKNVINATADKGVRRVVFTSSYGAVHMNPNRSPDQVVDESCWSDLEFCLKTKNLYCYAKTVAERTAMEEASRRGIQLLVVVPSLTLGEMLQPTLNLASQLIIVSYMTGAKKTYPNTVSGYVDVQDVARAHVLVCETPTAHGRYLCIGEVVHRSEFIRMMRELFPQYPITTQNSLNVNGQRLLLGTIKLTIAFCHHARRWFQTATAWKTIGIKSRVMYFFQKNRVVYNFKKLGSLWGREEKLS